VIRFEQAAARHASLVAQCMRARDIEEVRAGWGLEPQPAIATAMRKSFHMRVAFWDMAPLAVYGLSTLGMLAGSAQLWIFGTRHIDSHRIAFARASRRELAMLHKRVRIITNLIDKNDAPAMHWLQWLGGICELPDQERGGRVFAQFILEDKKCQQA
jgi:hypothetical protein